MTNPKVKILMGSDSDWEMMRECKEQLAEFGVEAEAEIASAHRTPERVTEICRNLEADGFSVVVCGAGHAAHLAGVVAAHTILPVIGVPLNSSPLNGLDSLLSTVQMPPGIPVATVAIGASGARNAGVLAAEILALQSKELREKLKQFRKEMALKVQKKNEKWAGNTMSMGKDPAFHTNPPSRYVGGEISDPVALIQQGKYFRAAEVLKDPSRLATALRVRGLGVIPTDTLYGLATRIDDDMALERLFRLKGRSLERQIPVLLEDPARDLPMLVADLPKKAEVLIEHFWPGPLTLVLRANASVSPIITGKTGSIGVRQSAHPVVRALLTALGAPITGTSANLTGARSPTRLAEIDRTILQSVDFVIDDGALGGRQGSTVLDFTGPHVKIIRQGDLPLARIQAVIAL